MMSFVSVEVTSIIHTKKTFMNHVEPVGGYTARTVTSVRPIKFLYAVKDRTNVLFAHPRGQKCF